MRQVLLLLALLAASANTATLRRRGIYHIDILYRPEDGGETVNVARKSPDTYMCVYYTYIYVSDWAISAREAIYVLHARRILISIILSPAKRRSLIGCRETVERYISCQSILNIFPEVRLYLYIAERRIRTERGTFVTVILPIFHTSLLF